MKPKIRSFLNIIAVAVAALALIWSVQVRLDDESQSPGRVPAEALAGTGAVLLDLDDDATQDEKREVARALQAAIAPAPWAARDLGTVVSKAAELYRISVPKQEHDDVLRALRAFPAVEAVEVEGTWAIPENDLAVAFPNEILADVIGEGFRQDLRRPEPSRDNGRFLPNDPYYKHQWHLDQIQMPAAWRRSRGKGAVVAIIDTGVSFETRDKRRRRFTMAPDLAGVRFVPGYDFVDRDAHALDEHGHGTHVAGTVAQATNNAVGVAGVAPEAAIMPLRVLDGKGRGSFGNVAAAIRWAADHGAHVINMSLGGRFPSKIVQRAVDYAHQKGVLVVAAAGNAGRSRVEYPAGHRHVLSVGAVRFDETLTFYSCYGRGLDVVAPGGDTRVDQNGDGVADGVLQNTLVRGTTDQHDYIPYMGTSMAAPHAAGVAALLWAQGIRDPDAIERVMKESAKRYDDQERYGAGLIQADNALKLARRGLSAARGSVAVLFASLLLFGIRRRFGLDPRLRVWPAVAGAGVLAGGLAAFGFEDLAACCGLSGCPTVVAWSSAALAGLPGLAGGFGPWANLLGVTVGAPLLLSLLLLGVRRMVPWLFAITLAMAAWAFVEALFPTTAWALLPTALVGPWLLLQAGLCAALAGLLARPSRPARS